MAIVRDPIVRVPVSRAEFYPAGTPVRCQVGLGWTFHGPGLVRAVPCRRRLVALSLPAGAVLALEPVALLSGPST